MTFSRGFNRWCPVACALLMLGCASTAKVVKRYGGNRGSEVRVGAIPLAGVNTYVITGSKGAVLVDAGGAAAGKKILKGLEKLAVRREQLKLIVITHGHFDHYGAAGEIRAATGAKIAVHDKDRCWVHKGEVVMPTGLTFRASFLLAVARMASVFVSTPPTSVDVVVGERGLSLAPFGIPGRVLHTPGHTPGSMTVLLDTGEAFVGDLAVNGFMTSSPSVTPVEHSAGDQAEIRRQLCRLKRMGARVIYPGHGDPFPIDELVKTKKRDGRSRR